ncbi:phosphonate ABC transporter substrate-binding protein [Labrys miyagiensis]
MLSRRKLLGLAAAAISFTATASYAQDWKAQYPELTLAVIPAENASTTADRYQPLADYLAKQVGVPVKLNIANDYAAVIEAQRAGFAQIAFYGPASYARAVITGVAAEPVAVSRHNNGLTGYYSVIYVKAESPYKTVADLKGKKLALVDPNSTSGNNAPRYGLHSEGIDIDSFFGSSFYAGSHDNAVLALAQGTADAAANSWNSEDDSNLTRMLSRGILKKDDGTLMTKADFRVIYKTPFLPEGPYAVLSSLPDDLKKKIATALTDYAKNDKPNFDKLSDGKDLELAPISAKEYEPIVEMVKFNDSLRKTQ